MCLNLASCYQGGMMTSVKAANNLSNPSRGPALRRVLGLWLLVLYGLGGIIGAGIYVLVGAVADVAGFATPVSFVLAGVLAGLTGLSYAELSVRYPEAAGAAVYVREAFGSDALSRLIGFCVVAVGVFLAASLSRGAVGYLNRFIEVAELPAALALVAGFTVIACIGVGSSVKTAAIMTLVEILGLVIVVIAGVPMLIHLPDIVPAMMPTSSAVASGIALGTFLAFFAFLGFEDIVNMAEETSDARRVLPRAILLTILITTVIYGIIALVAVTAVPMEKLAGSRAPLELIVEGVSWVPSGTLSVIALIAVPNGILITLVMLARILYGMARRGWVPSVFGHVNARTRTPLFATLVSGAAVAGVAGVINFVGLVTLTSAVNLFVFTVVNCALWKLHRTTKRVEVPGPGTFHVPLWVPPLGAICSLALLATQFLI
ncbi:MAG: amino acid permease [Rhodospirillales bacterium]|nr:amino acid permease [Rhodospirillales bacterium]MBT6743107.1 amino acid permease [Rhodospirillales bacterium]